MPKLKSRIRDLYQFLREVTQLRFSAVRKLKDQPRTVSLKSLPEHLSIQLFHPIQEDGTTETPIHSSASIDPPYRIARRHLRSSPNG
jgi:hypothetical protein